MVSIKPLYTTIKVTERTQTQKLPVFEQLKLLLGKVSTDETIKLEASEKVSRANLEMQAALSNLIDNVTRRMKEIGHTSATISISSRFKPYFDDVLSPIGGKGRFYDFIIEDKEMPVIGVDYFLLLKVKEKED